MTLEYDQGAVAETVPAIHAPRRKPLGHGTKWLREAWHLFAPHWLLWIGGLLVLWLVSAAVSVLPGVGQLAQVILAPVLYAGIYEVARKGDYNESPAFADFFAGFRDRAGALLRLGLLCTGLVLALMLVALALFWLLADIDSLVAVGAALEALEAGDATPWQTLPPETLQLALLAMLVFALLWVPYTAAIWFATPLVFYDADIRPLRACGLSLEACLRNVLPLTLYTLAALGLCLLAVLTAGIGFVVVLPLLFISAYTSFHDIFMAPEHSRFV